MLVIGAKGHAKEVIEIIKNNCNEIVFFDNVTTPPIDSFFNTFCVLNSFDELSNYFTKNSAKFCLGIGGTKIRQDIANKIKSYGGQLETITAQNASIGNYEVSIGDGCNIMKNVMISNSVTLGEGVLINYGVSIHHDVSVGNYCEISPGAMLLGRSKIGHYVSIGAGAIILPDVIIGDNVIIGAGAVVTKSIENNAKVIGIPAKHIN